MVILFHTSKHNLHDENQIMSIVYKIELDGCLRFQ